MKSCFKKNGFSLIELSVVLVIVGLLVGGVLVGRNYIRNSELNTLVGEAKYYINAFGQFQQRYRALPGDMATATSTWAGTFNGDGNGRVRAAGVANTAEVFYVFQHLNKAGLIDGSYTGATTGAGGTFHARAGVNVPRAAMVGVAYMFDHPDALNGNVSADALYFDGMYGHVLRTAGLSETATNLPQDVFLTPQQALAIDNKFDDGKPGAGFVVTPKTTALANCSSSATLYNVSFTRNACYLFFRVQ